MIFHIASYLLLGIKSSLYYELLLVFNVYDEAHYIVIQHTVSILLGRFV